MRKLLYAALIALAISTSLVAQITIPYSFVAGTVIDPDQMNANFLAVSAACARIGCTMTGPVKVVAGTNALPGISNSADASTGIAVGATNTIGMSLAGVQRWLLNASGLTIFGNNLVNNTGKIPDLSSTYFTAINAGNFTAGTVPTARLGSGAAGSTTFLRGDQTWAVPVTVTQVGRCDLRLSLTTGVPVTTADVLAAGSVFVTPTAGAQCSFYDGSTSWVQLSSIAQVTVTVPAVASQMYDIFCFNNAGTMACDAATAWTNDTTRATALVTQDGVYVKSGATTRRYIGSFRTTAVASQTEDSVLKRFVWSYYNRVDRALLVQETTASWAYSTATIRQVNGSTANQVAVVVGVAEVTLRLEARTTWGNAATTYVQIGVGEDSTTTISTKTTGGVGGNGAGSGSLYVPMTASFVSAPTVGYHYFAQLEGAATVPTTTFQGATAGFVAAGRFTGMAGAIEG